MIGLTETLLEVLEHFVVATLLTFLMQLLSGHPELNGEGTGTEWAGLVETLDSFLRALNFLVKNEVLVVGGLGVEVFTLAQFN